MAGGAAAVLLAGGALVAVGTSTAGATTFDTDCSTSTPCTFTVAAGVCQVTIAAWGGSGGVSSGDGGFGVGGRIQANFTVTAGQVLSVVVGQVASDGGPGGDNTGGTGFNTGGTGSASPSTGDGAGGGGSSAVTSGGTPLIVAGGGGGGGDGFDGGNGGVATTAGPTDPGTGSNGLGGSTGGAGGAAQGTAANGGNGAGNGGGGGAGAAPGQGSTNGGSDANGGGGGGGNATTSTAALTDPGVLSGRDGQVTITAAAPGVGCPTTPATVVTAPTAAFTG